MFGYEYKPVHGHIEVTDGENFLFSADTVAEADRELDNFNFPDQLVMEGF